MNTRDKLTSLFMRFPGIGSRQAERFVYFLLRSHPQFIEDIIEGLKLLKQEVNLCESCYGYFDIKKGALCKTCSNKNIDDSTLMIVAKDVDMETIQKAGGYDGKFFILGGLIPLLEKHDSPVRLNTLIALVKKRIPDLREIIIALSANPEGDHTTLEIKKALAPLQGEDPFTITTLGRGLSTGTELEYSDAETIKHAMENRH